VAYFAKEADRGTIYALRRRVGRHELGVVALDRGQLADQVVVLRIADLGVVEVEIAMVVVRDELPELFGPSGSRAGGVD
jgi:hypothetical protein